MNGESSHSQALTKSEMLVIAAIILMLIGLLFPLLFKAKKKEIRVRCLNTQKQIGLAIHNYASSNTDMLPGILTYSPTGNPATEPASPFFFSLLPYLEQDTLFKAGGNGMGLTPWSNIVRQPAVINLP